MNNRKNLIAGGILVLVVGLLAVKLLFSEPSATETARQLVTETPSSPAEVDSPESAAERGAITQPTGEDGRLTARPKDATQPDEAPLSAEPETSGRDPRSNRRTPRKPSELVEDEFEDADRSQQGDGRLRISPKRIPKP